MTGLIYKATNKLTKQVYVGQTTLTLRQRINGHHSEARRNKTSMYFHRAIRKYGEAMFEWEIIVDNVPIELLNDLETNCIAMENAYLCGYNLCPSGGANRGWKPSEQTLENMRKAQKGRTFTASAKEKMSKAQSGTKNHKFSPWYIYTRPSGTFQYFFTTTIRDYASSLGIPETSIKNCFYKTPRKGKYKNYIFAYFKDLKWTSTLQPNHTVSLTPTSFC